MFDDNLDKFRGVVKEEVNTALEPVVKKLDALWDQTVKLTENMVEIQETLDSHSLALKRIEEAGQQNADNVKRLEKRTTEAENKLGIVSPLELTISG